MSRADFSRTLGYYLIMSNSDQILFTNQFSAPEANRAINFPCVMGQCVKNARRYFCVSSN